MSTRITDTTPMPIPTTVAPAAVAPAAVSHAATIAPAAVSAGQRDQRARAKSTGVIRPLLWLLVIACATGNVITSVSGLVAVSVALGVLTLGFGVALARHHYRTRRR